MISVSRPSVASRRGLVLGGRVAAVGVLLSLGLDISSATSTHVPMELTLAGYAASRWLLVIGSLVVVVTVIGGRVRRSLPPLRVIAPLLAGVGLAWVGFIITHSIGFWTVSTLPLEIGQGRDEWRVWSSVELAVSLVTGLAAVFVLVSGSVRIQRAASVAEPVADVPAAV